jgi:peptide subunit release factor 1 (eRF1)
VAQLPSAGLDFTDPQDKKVGWVLGQVEDTETGLVVFLGDELVVAVAPPFPVAADIMADGAETSHLAGLLDEDFLIGLVLLRLGRFAVGVMRGERLLASKTGSRYVKNRHRAGGSSQRRFERSRERLVRELYDKACSVTQDVFAPYHDRLEFILMGGERHTLQGFVRRCDYLEALAGKTLSRHLEMDRPGQAALDGIAREVWRSRVMVFSPEGEANVS